MKYFSLLICLLLIGCGRGANIDPELQPYVDEIEEKAEFYTGQPHKVNVNLFIGETNNYNDGECRSKGGSQKIIINRRLIKNHPYEKNIIIGVILHELGHCLLGLKHNYNYTNVNNKNIPESIMHPNASRVGALLKKHEEYYYKQIFKDYLF